MAFREYADKKTEKHKRSSDLRKHIVLCRYMAQILQGSHILSVGLVFKLYNRFQHLRSVG